MKNKKFDCVDMKNKIQKELLEEKKKCTKQEWQEMSRKKVEQDAILGPYLEKFKQTKKKEKAKEKKEKVSRSEW
ncbi:MAG: hypothetical protein HQK49_03255 [Oligoflexia bacterium]|nr:hypothetical protein [Oligoflexia bacterium]